MNRESLIYGFAIFSMFFGSGNLVFPLQVGQYAGNLWLIAFWGLFLSAVLLPFLGLFVIKLYRGDYERFFGEIGKAPGAVITIFTLSLLGSFGVVPRCITVAHAGIYDMFPQVSLFAFSLVFSILCYLACLKDSIMISIIGKWMTPILLVFLVILIFNGVTSASDLEYRSVDPIEIFQSSILIGYRTMDLFAAFFFSAIIFKQIQDNMPKSATSGQVVREALVPSIIGASLLGAVYMGFVYLGSYYSGLIEDVPSELMLPTIASHLLGKNAALIIAVIIIFSCMTTAVVLNNIYARYIYSKLKMKSEKKFAIILLCTTSISFLISLLDFSRIGAFLAPVLKVSYPSLILLTMLGIFSRKHRMFKVVGFYIILILSIIYW